MSSLSSPKLDASCEDNIKHSLKKFTRFHICMLIILHKIQFKQIKANKIYTTNSWIVHMYTFDRNRSFPQAYNAQFYTWHTHHQSHYTMLYPFNQSELPQVCTCSGVFWGGGVPDAAIVLGLILLISSRNFVQSEKKLLQKNNNSLKISRNVFNSS
jgi:hypothetical protein